MSSRRIPKRNRMRNRERRRGEEEEERRRKRKDVGRKIQHTIQHLTHRGVMLA